MLPRSSRMTRSAEFGRVVREGARAGSRLLVVHLRTSVVEKTAPTAPQVGFVVSKGVGGSVVRNRVERRLRHLVRPHLTSLPAGSSLVVRALPSSAEASYDDLGVALSDSLRRASRGRR